MTDRFKGVGPSTIQPQVVLTLRIFLINNYIRTHSKTMYLLPFSDNDNEHDFSLLTKTIKEYFPVAKGKRLQPESVWESPGFKKMGAIIQAEFTDRKAYRSKWDKLTRHLSKVLQRKVYGFPDLGGGGFIGEVIIAEDNKPDFERKKSLNFYVSIIGPFFSIQGIDSSNAILRVASDNTIADNGNFQVTHALTASPSFEYEEPFRALEKELREFFPGYQFVPYEIGMSTMKNISIEDELRDPRSIDTIYEALFGQQAVHTCIPRGDQRYGMNDWIRSLNEKEKSLANQIAQNSRRASDEITVHKVWKLTESKRLDTFNVTGNLMFGMDLFDLIDLTDTSNFIMTSPVSGTPTVGKYSIKKDIIKVNRNLSFRIVSLSKDILTLNMILNFKQSSVAIKGEAAELRFIEMQNAV